MKHMKVVFWLSSGLPLLFLFNNCSGEFTGNQEQSVVNESQNSTSSNNTNTTSPATPTSTPPFAFESINTEKIDSNLAVVAWTTTHHALAYIIYGTNPDKLSSRTAGEESFNYRSHRQSIKNLKPETSYFFQIITEDKEGRAIASEINKFMTKAEEDTSKTNTKREPAEVAIEANEFWTKKGYSLVFSSTPTESDIGKNPRQYFETKWSNGHPLIRYISNDMEISLAPDGSPSSRVKVKVGGKVTPVSIVGNQLGLKGPEAQVVYSLETYFECVNGQSPEGLTYVGHGHHWGSEDNVRALPGGSQNREDSWSLRIPISKSGYYYAYAYIPDKDVAYGRSFIFDTFPKPTCGRWEKMEYEVVQNSPVNNKNGIFRIYLNGKKVLDKSGLQIRKRPTVRPKGMGFFVQVRSLQNKKPFHMYYRNWKIYTK